MSRQSFLTETSAFRGGCFFNARFAPPFACLCHLHDEARETQVWRKYRKNSDEDVSDHPQPLIEFILSIAFIVDQGGFIFFVNYIDKQI